MTRPQSIAYGLTDSPVMQLTWIVDLDQLLTLVSEYWFGGGGAGAANFLYEAADAPAGLRPGAHPAELEGSYVCALMS